MMDNQQPRSPSLEELLAIMAAQNPDTGQEKPSPGRDALAALIARSGVNRLGEKVTGPMTNIGIRG